MMAREPYEDTEYQFSEGEEGEVVYEEGEEPSPAYDQPVKKKVSKLSKKNIVILIIMAIIAVLIVYKVVSLLLGGFVKEQPVKAVRPVTSIVTTQVPPVAPKPEEEVSMEVPAEEPVIPEPVVPKMEDPQPVVQEEVDQEIRGAISDQMSKLQERSQQLMQELKVQHDATRDHFVSLEEKIEELDSNISDLRDAMQSLSSQIKKLEVAERIKTKRRVQEQQVRDQKIRSEQQYFVEAVIPGRAWLRAYDGSAMTVTIGEVIPGYGRVTSINSYSGVVTTSSGNEIHYGVDN